jgi:hypothetical protein
MIYMTIADIPAERGADRFQLWRKVSGVFRRIALQRHGGVVVVMARISVWACTIIFAK